MFTSPGEIAFRVFDFPIHWYGIIMALSIFTGLSVIYAIQKKYHSHIPKDVTLDLAFYLIIGGILGARIYYVILDFPYYFKHPQEIIALWHGGLSIHGCIIGATIVCWIYLKRNKYNFLEIADLFSYGLILGQSIGRWGNFFNSEAFGSPTDLPWKLFIPLNDRPLEYYNYEYFHPTFLYESIINIIIFIILFFGIKNIPSIKKGTIFFSYLILYSVGRLFIEGIRIDSILDIGKVPIAQVVSVLFILIGTIGIIHLSKKKTVN